MRNRDEGEFPGPYARNTHRGFGDDYARDRGWSGGGGHDDYVREDRPSFRGRGPKNWRRNDERIREEVNERLTYHDGVDATDIDVTVDNGEITLNGHVGSRWEKRIAEDVAESVHGVHDVHNRLQVVDREVHIGKASE
jgi:osmotically-inducible protein OsmY